MRILYICHRFPFPPFRGGKIRPFNMIRHLSRRHEVTVASLARTAEEARTGAGLAEHCQEYIVEVIPQPLATLRMIARLPTPVPSSMGNFYSPRLASRLRRLLQERSFDLVFVHCSSVAQYVEDVSGIPKMLDFGDMDSQKWLAYAAVRRFPLSLGYWLEGRKLARAERALTRSFDYCTCTTRAELATLQSYGPKAPTGWFANGVDTDYFSPDAEPYDPESICFMGRMDYFPNQQGMITFCREVLPLIQERRRSVHLTIVGAAPSDEIRRLGGLPGVTVTGTVADVRPYVRRSTVTVAPLAIARGTQNKILESLAMGVPVVASVPAADGIDAVPGEHFLTAGSPRGFADAVLRLIEDRSERTRLSEAGRARVLSHHNWERSMQKLDGLIEDCMGRVQA